MQPASKLRSERFLYRVSRSLGFTGLPAHCLLRRVFECERLRRDGDDEGLASRQGECERGDAECDEKRENEANVLDRKGRGVVGLDIGLMYRAGSGWGMGRPAGDDVAFPSIAEAKRKRAQIPSASVFGSAGKAAREGSPIREDGTGREAKIAANTHTLAHNQAVDLRSRPIRPTLTKTTGLERAEAVDVSAGGCYSTPAV